MRMMAKENQPNNTSFTAGVVVEPWDLQFAKLTTEPWGIGKCAVLDYGNTVINPGGKSDWAVVVDPGILKINNGILTIQVPTTGIYSLGVVGASGTWIKTIFSGTWNKGVTELDLKTENLISGQYIVLRQGSVVLDQINWP